jgi:hypothetical protein
MSLRPGFLAQLEEKSDEELLGMLAEAHGYLPEAVDAVHAELARRGVDASQAPRSAPPPLFSADNLPELPKIWIGFLISFAFLAVEILQVVLGQRAELGILILVVAIGGWIYWLFCVSRFHDVANALAGFSYPISAHSAVVRHFIPFYNFFWMVKWPMEMEKYFSANTSVRMINGTLLGLGLLAAVFLRFIDGFLGYCALFGVGAYIASKLRRIIRERREQKDRLAEVFA